MNRLNFDTFYICRPEVVQFRVLGFGALLFDARSPVGQAIGSRIMALPVFPGWRFSLCSPWL